MCRTTDVDDKNHQQSHNKEGKTMAEILINTLKKHSHDKDGLNVKRATVHPSRATEEMDGIIAMVQTL